MLSDTMASNGAVGSTPHDFAHTSISSGGSTLLSPVNLIHLAVLTRESESGSLGNHVTLGIAPAKCTACSPVPQPISSTTPFAGRTRFRTKDRCRIARSRGGELALICAHSALFKRNRWTVIALVGHGPEVLW